MLNDNIRTSLSGKSKRGKSIEQHIKVQHLMASTLY
jgi:hypothetical protein